MSEQEDNKEALGKTTSVERQTIRDVITAQVETGHQERRDHERAERRRAQDERIQKRRADDLRGARTRKASNLRAINQANARVRTHVASAAQSLKAALRDASGVPLPGHSEEGRKQQRTIRAIQDVVASLRRVGAGNFDETDFEVDLDLDVG